MDWDGGVRTTGQHTDPAVRAMLRPHVYRDGGGWAAVEVDASVIFGQMEFRSLCMCGHSGRLRSRKSLQMTNRLGSYWGREAAPRRREQQHG